MRKWFLLFLLVLLCQIQSLNMTLAKNGKPPTPEQQYKYEQKALKTIEKEKYERSILPESGYMTTEEYEQLSKDIPNADKKIPEYKQPRDVKMKYIPQPVYKLERYNNPPGSVELHLERRFKFDRQINGGAITSPNKDILVYPVVYYYAMSQCTAGDLFVIPLDKSLPDSDRVLRANVVKRIPQPILSTEKDISQGLVFRTMTPVDFSTDGTLLAAKEKIGGSSDGIWQTNLWVYDFTTGKARKIPEIREAIKYYWKSTQGLVLDEKRWDITPLGFDVNNPDRIIVSAYGYTGKAPKFLGNWSVDCHGERTELVSLLDASAQVSVNGWKAVQVDVIPPSTVKADEKRENKKIKKQKKADKKAKKADKKAKKHALKKKLREMKHETNATMNQFKKQDRYFGPTGAN